MVMPAMDEQRYEASSESSDEAATITRKASQAYRSLSASDKAALKYVGFSKRQPMTAEKIGRKIEQLVFTV